MDEQLITRNDLKEELCASLDAEQLRVLCVECGCPEGDLDGLDEDGLSTLLLEAMSADALVEKLFSMQVAEEGRQQQEAQERVAEETRAASAVEVAGGESVQISKEALREELVANWDKETLVAICTRFNLPSDDFGAVEKVNIVDYLLDFVTVSDLVEELMRIEGGATPPAGADEEPSAVAPATAPAPDAALATPSDDVLPAGDGAPPAGDGVPPAGDGVPPAGDGVLPAEEPPQAAPSAIPPVPERTPSDEGPVDADAGGLVTAEGDAGSPDELPPGEGDAGLAQAVEEAASRRPLDEEDDDAFSRDAWARSATEEEPPTSDLEEGAVEVDGDDEAASLERRVSSLQEAPAELSEASVPAEDPDDDGDGDEALLEELRALRSTMTSPGSSETQAPPPLEERPAGRFSKGLLLGAGLAVLCYVGWTQRARMIAFWKSTRRVLPAPTATAPVPTRISAGGTPRSTDASEVVTTAVVPVETGRPEPIPSLRPGATEAPTTTEIALATPVPTETVSATPVPTETVSATPVPTETVSATPVPTEMAPATPVPTPAPTVPVTPVPTQIVSVTPVPTQIVSVTPVPTQIVSATPVPTQIVSATSVPTPTVPATSVPTPTETVSATATATPTGEGPSSAPDTADAPSGTDTAPDGYEIAMRRLDALLPRQEPSVDPLPSEMADVPEPLFHLATRFEKGSWKERLAALCASRRLDGAAEEKAAWDWLRTPKGYVQRGVSFLLREKIAWAQGSLRKARREVQGRDRAWVELLLGNAEMAGGSMAEAEAAWNAAAELEPGMREVWLMRARAARSRDAVEEERRILAEGASRIRDFREADELLLVSTEGLEATLRRPVLLAMVARRPRFSKALMALGKILEGEDARGEAACLYQRALDGDGTWSPDERLHALRHLAEMHRAWNRSADELSALRELRRMGALEEGESLRLARLFHRFGHWLEAAEAYRKIAATAAADGTGVALLMRAGDCLTRARRFEDAAEVYRDVVARDPTNVKAQYEAAFCLYAAGRIDLARKYAEMAERLGRKPDPAFRLLMGLQAN